MPRQIPNIGFLVSTAYFITCSSIVSITGSINLDNPHEGIYHNVTKVENFGIAKLLPDEFKVNTYHHQCPKDLPKGFKKLFVNYDIIEMIEHESLPILATQWHPERIDSNESRIIMKYFFDLL